jgi:hypothetical protein
MSSLDGFFFSNGLIVVAIITCCSGFQANEPTG